MSCSNTLNNTQSDNRINRCRVCDKTYARPSTLKTHMRTHSVTNNSSYLLIYLKIKFFNFLRVKNHINVINVIKHLHKQLI